jgi:hypothetical protein
MAFGFLLGRYVHRGTGSEKPVAIADAQEVVAAYNNNGNGQQTHIVGWQKIAPGLWRFGLKENGRQHFGCLQIHVRQFWHGQGTDFHGVGRVNCA